MNEELKQIIVEDINLKIGGDINDLSDAYELENDLIDRRNKLQSSLKVVNNEVPTKLSLAVKKAELNSTQIENLKNRSETLKEKIEDFLKRTEPLCGELEKRFVAINRLDHVLTYLKSFEKIDEICRQMKQCNDDEQLVLWYGELKEMCELHKTGHRATYVREYTHYWHNILKDKISKSYEDILKLIKWPAAPGMDNSPLPKEVLVKFCNLTRYLFLIEEPESATTNTVSEDFGREEDPCLPVRILLRPLKKRFAFHFTGTRQTARIDRPEWFLTQTLNWIKDHQSFVRNHVQPVADKLDLRKIRAVEQFQAGLIALAAERLHTVLGLYYTQPLKAEHAVDVDAAFAHAVDETLGFHRELVAITGNETNGVLSVLTRAETFVLWLSIEKKYALSKMDEILGSEQWSEAVAQGVGAAVGAVVWVPRGADWFVALLKTIEDRYAVLPQPGHRLQFLELQLDLIEEWRVRLTQLLNAATETLRPETFLAADASPHPLTAVINAAHHTRTTLLQWAHSLHYLQLHFYRRQFFHFTQQQHHDDSETSSEDEEECTEDKKDGDEETLSLKDVEARAKKLALNEACRGQCPAHDQSVYDMTFSTEDLTGKERIPGGADEMEAGVFAEAPSLLAHLRDSGLASLTEHILLEFKAGLREYKNQKWHALLMVEEMALSVSAPLCRPLAALCARLAAAAARLAPALAARLRAHLAQHVDQYLFEEVVLECWFNTGGTIQFTHDVKRNLVPAFAPPNKVASQCNPLPKLMDACRLLNMDYDDARRLRTNIAKAPQSGIEGLVFHGIRHIDSNQALKILNQRTDLCDGGTPSSVMELF